MYVGQCYCNNATPSPRNIPITNDITPIALEITPVAQEITIDYVIQSALKTIDNESEVQIKHATTLP